MLVKGIVLLVVVYSLLGLFLYLKQRSFLYFPTPVVDHDFKEWGFENDGIKLRVIEVNSGNEPAVVYFGGNAESVAFTAGELANALPGFTIYFFNYRGYGGSQGQPSERAILSDANTLIKALQSQHRSLSIIGRSLGSGVAIYLASIHEINKLILVTPYDSILAVAQSSYPVYPVKLMLKDTYRSDQWAPNVNADLLILAASNDRVIPSKHTKRLRSHFTQANIREITIEGTDHNSISHFPEYLVNIQKFMAGQQQNKY